MIDEPNSLITELRGLILNSCPEGFPIKVAIYSNPEECEALWETLESHKDTFPWPNLVIIFDGQDEITKSEVRPEYWLTPWDWAVAVSLHLGRANRKLPSEGFRCLIVDLMPEGWGAAGRARFKSVGSLLPWVRWYRPLQKDRPVAHSFNDMFRDLGGIGNPEFPSLDLASARGTDLASCSILWTALFGIPENRHAIGNLIGPIVLAEGVQRLLGVEVSVFPGVVGQRFRSLVRSVGIGRETVVRSHASCIQPLYYEQADGHAGADLERFQHLRLHLVDDQFSLGYHEILANLLFGADHIRQGRAEIPEARAMRHGAILRSRSNPDEIIQLLRECLTGSTSGPPRAIKGVDILFLDLRLFSGTGPCVRERELNTIGALVELCRSLGDLEHLEHSRRLKEAIAAAIRRRNDILGKIALDTTEEDSRDFVAAEDLSYLTLLPLLVCAIDPSLPIVLFSSTHQREIVGVFREYSNVITSFSKPVVSGYAVNDLVTSTTHDLTEAIRRALSIHSVRNVWLKLCDFSAQVGTGSCQIQERLLPKESAASTGFTHNTYIITRDYIDILAAEYQNLLVSGRFADSLQLPDNLLESIGGKFWGPRELECQRVIQLIHWRRNGEKWVDTIERLMADRSSRSSVLRTVYRSLVHSYRDLAEHVRHLPQSVATLGSGDLRAAVNDALTQAMEYRESLAEQQLKRLTQNFQLVGDYQFYTIIAALRNARSHFQCRPFRDDSELESPALWLWSFFLVTLRLKAAGVVPIHATGAYTTEAIRHAAAQHWLPDTDFSGGTTGEDCCKSVIARFGNLLILNAFKVDSALEPLAQYARRCAASWNGDLVGREE